MDLMFRFAKKTDLSSLLHFIRKLADYENMLVEVIIT